MHKPSVEYLELIMANKSLRQQNFYGAVHYTEDYDVPLAYETIDGAAEYCVVRRIVIMSDELKGFMRSCPETATTNEYCVTAVHIRFENAENYFEKRDYGPNQEFVYADEIEPDIRVIVTGDPNCGVFSVKELMEHSPMAKETMADVTYDWTVRHQLPEEWHNIIETMLPRPIAIIDIGGLVNTQRGSFCDIMFCTYRIMVTLHLCIR